MDNAPSEGIRPDLIEYRSTQVRFVCVLYLCIGPGRNGVVRMKIQNLAKLSRGIRGKDPDI